MKILKIKNIILSFLLIIFTNIKADPGKVRFTNKTKEMLFSIKYSKTGSKTMSNWTKRIGPKDHLNDGLKSSRIFSVGNLGRDIDKLKIKVYWDKDGNGKGIYKGEFEISLTSENNVKIKNNKTSEVELSWSAKNQKPIIRYKRAKDDKTVSFSKSFKPIVEEGGILYLHNESPTKTMKFTIPNLDNDQKKPNELTLGPNKSGKIEIGERTLGLGAHNVQLRIDVYKGSIFEGTFEWDKKINVKKGEFTHVFFKWNPNKIIKLRRKLYKPTKENDPSALVDDLIEQNYGHTAGGMGVVRFTNNTNKNIKIFSSTGKSGSFAQNIEVQLKPNQSKSFPTGNKDNDLINMVAMISGKENNARFWSKNIKVKEGDISRVVFNLNKSGSLYRFVEEPKDNISKLKTKIDNKDIKKENREYGKIYSPKITYRIHNNSGKDISLEIRHSDLAKGAKVGGVAVGIVLLTIVAYYASLAIYSSYIGSLTSAQLATVSGIAGNVGGSGLLYDIAATAAYKAVLAAGSQTTGSIAITAAKAAVTTAKVIAGGSALGTAGTGTNLTLQALKNIESLNPKIGFIGEIKITDQDEDELDPQTTGSKTSNGFIVALPKDCTFWGFEGKDIHDVKITSYISGNRIYYDDQHKFRIYKKFNTNNITFNNLKEKDSKKIDIRQGGDEITEIRIDKDFSVYASEPIEKNKHDYYKENGFYAKRSFLQKLKIF